VVLESLACKYRLIHDRATSLIGYSAPIVHIMGGGSQNCLLNQFTANILNTPIIAGPAEATTLGNILVQMQALGLIRSLEEGRELIRRSVHTDEFAPQEVDRWEAAYQNFLARTGLAAVC